MSSTKRKQGDIALLNLRSEDLRRLARPHPGYERFVPTLVALARANPDAIAQAGLDFDALAKHVDDAAALATPISQLEEQLKLLSDTRFFHDSSAFSQLMILYDRCKSAARTDPAIARALAPIEAFLKHKKQKKAATPPPTTP